MPSAGESFVFKFGLMSEINQEAQRHFGRVKIVNCLGTKLINNFGNGFDFHDNLIEANEVWFKMGNQSPVSISKRQLWL